MKMSSALVAISATLFAGCAITAPPSELSFARAAYEHIRTGQAQALVPAEVLKAEEALNLAEQSFQKDPRSFETRDLAYAANRMAHHAELLGVTAAAHAAPVAYPPSSHDAEGLHCTRSHSRIGYSAHCSYDGPRIRNCTTAVSAGIVPAYARHYHVTSIEDR